MKKILSLLAISAALLFALTGCSSGDAGNTDANGEANQQDDTYHVAVAAQSNSGQVFQYVAEAHGFLEEEGVDVELIYINNGTDAFTAMTAGQVDVMSTYGTGGPLIQIANGQEYTLFGGYMRLNGLAWKVFAARLLLSPAPVLRISCSRVSSMMPACLMKLPLLK